MTNDKTTLERVQEMESTIATLKTEVANLKARVARALQAVREQAAK